jgi:thiol-disulfide isomerase/thioredoxin
MIMKIKIMLLAGILIVSSMSMAQTTPEPAGKILEAAYTQAAKENKHVMVIFHASWCGWCKKLEASMADPSCKDFFDKYFVITHLDIMEQYDKKNLENPEATEVFNKYGGSGGGIPFFLIFDKKGTLLADSKIRPAGAGFDTKGQNMGCPASDEEVAAFIQILKKTTKINDSQITAITERFKKNRN